MYTLTEITTTNENVTYHQKLGDRFSVIDRESSPKEFERTYNVIYQQPDAQGKYYELKDINENIHCLVVSEGGREIFQLDKNNFYYVVTENGKTFKNLTFK